MVAVGGRRCRTIWATTTPRAESPRWWRDATPPRKRSSDTALVKRYASSPAAGHRGADKLCVRHTDRAGQRYLGRTRRAARGENLIDPVPPSSNCSAARPYRAARRDRPARRRKAAPAPVGLEAPHPFAQGQRIVRPQAFDIENLEAACSMRACILLTRSSSASGKT